ncbi:FtsX-like permease family protein [Kitasatospora sp. MAP5-34]|uniref:ABC transporter permease n=1 Tax=Kitasatospora sp. MAP5-34 TaxID=3035102 RepID=UPI0024737355|nr:FtsX-like permease family protein [Kitasatospora sp. MAP5-34]MDH6580642.1 putative ABC transport system permease protein [Kitasatospora sp. MAP5-34]
MSAVWRASRAAVRRRKLQTTIIGVVVLLSTATITIALALLAAAAAPFDDAFSQQSGAHVVATFDSSKVSDVRLAQTAHRQGVRAAAGPFGEAVVVVPDGTPGIAAGPLTVVGRSGSDSPVDHLNLWAGRWPTGPGEIVLNSRPSGRGASFPPEFMVPLPGGSKLRVVGFASSVSQSAGAWVTPDQLAGLHPQSVQMLYRFADPGTDQSISAGLATATAGLPSDALTGSQSYLALKKAVAGQTDAYVPFLMTFGVLGLVVAVLIVANVVSGAVVSGFRHIGVLKALGFTPNQVAAVYVLMISVPAVVGCLIGIVLGNVLARPLLFGVFQGLGVESVSVSLWVDVVALLGMPAVVALAALGPAMRAHRLSAAEAISAGGAPRVGRALGVQRRLGATRLPRSVSLGLGLPFARPARTVLTMAAIVLGVAAVALASGLTSTMTAYGNAEELNGAYQVEVTVGGHRPDRPAPTLSDTDTQALLRSLGAVRVTADAWQNVKFTGSTQGLNGQFLRGDSASLNYTMVKGHWLDGPGQLVVSGAFLRQRGLAVGDQVRLDLGAKEVPVTIVGQLMAYDPDGVLSNWDTLMELAPGQRASHYMVQLAPGADADAFVTAFQKASGPGLYPAKHANELNQATLTIVSFATLFTLMLAAVAALGVFNTVVLTTHERRRNLGMLKSIGMTPRQVTVMMVTSMAALGAVGGLIGLPLGVLAHRLVVPAMVRAAGIDLPASMLHVWHAPLLALLAFAGLVIAILGALIPARSAARLTIAQVLHNE